MRDAPDCAFSASVDAEVQGVLAGKEPLRCNQSLIDKNISRLS
ncbi:hypothetical protein [Silvania confinis]|nr:hypothetical protein [Silvania confinis]